MATTAAPLDVATLKKDFPILDRQMHGKRLVYLDSAATTQKPRAVIEAISRYYEHTNANIHRGVYALAEEATDQYEGARERVAQFIGMPESQGIVFTRNATEAINLVRFAWARKFLKPGHEILTSVMEHHSNFVPWILAARETGATVKHVRLLENGTLDLAHFHELLSPRTKLVALTQASNVLGTINPVKDLIAAAHKAGAVVLIDGAQSVPHLKVDWNDLGADFLAFSAHKMLGPTGIGVLAAKPEHLENMDPFMGGGSMIREVKLDRATWNDIPWKFEAGTPNIADAIAFTASLDYLEKVGMDAIRAHEIELTDYALKKMSAIPGMTIYGPLDAKARGGVVSFNIEGLHPHDLSTVVDQHGVAIRAGHHCAQPLMRHLGVVATARASFYLYNDHTDVDALVAALQAAKDYFGPRHA